MLHSFLRLNECQPPESGTQDSGAQKSCRMCLRMCVCTCEVCVKFVSTGRFSLLAKLAKNIHAIPFHFAPFNGDPPTPLRSPFENPTTTTTTTQLRNDANSYSNECEINPNHNYYETC